MMKTKLIYIFLSLVLLSSCSGEDYDRPLQQGGEALQLSVRVGNFVTDGTPDTRADDSGEKNAFEEGDRMGIIVLDKDGEILSDNIPYIYSGSAWSFDSNSNEGKVAVNYNNRASTYLAYFPYSKGANGINSIDGLKEKFQPLSDQRTKDAYRASDLLVWNETYETSPKKLEIALEHVYSLLSFPSSVNITCNVSGVSTPVTYSSSLISDVSFTLGGNPYSAYKAADGSYRIITVPQSMTTSDRWLVAYGAKTYSGSMSATTLAEKTRYTLTPSLSLGDYSLDKATVGDFYCKDATSGNGYLIPGDIASLTNEQKTACLGIVFWLGNINSENYNLLDDKFSNGTHGLVVSLWDLADPDNGEAAMYWTYGKKEKVQDKLSVIWKESPKDYDTKSKEKMQGYINTFVLRKYNTYVEDSNESDYGKNSQYRIKPLYALDSFKKVYPTPSNSSGWYWPSVRELKYVCWGQGNDSQGTKGKEMVNTQIRKANGTVFDNNDYWTSTEDNVYNSNAGRVDFNNGYPGSGNKTSCTYYVRSILAF